MNAALTQGDLKRLMSYEPETGAFVWISGLRAGVEAGSWHSRGYKTACIAGRSYKCHRLAWLYVYGVWPADEIDHINGIKHDNRIVNLREATRRQNMQNMVNPKQGNKTGLRGVSPSGRKFMARISDASQEHYLGLFNTAQEAHQAYLTAKATLHV